MLRISELRTSGLFMCLLMSAALISACSTTKVKKLTTVEIAQELLKEQQLRPEFKNDKLVTLRYIVPGKAVIGKEMEITLEIISTQDLSNVTLAFNPSTNVHFKGKWLILSQDMIIRKIKILKANRIHKETVILIPDKEGLVKMDTYALYKIKERQIAKQISVSFSIGDILKK